MQVIDVEVKDFELKFATEMPALILKGVEKPEIKSIKK